MVQGALNGGGWGEVGMGGDDGILDWSASHRSSRMQVEGCAASQSCFVTIVTALDMREDGMKDAGYHASLRLPPGSMF